MVIRRRAADTATDVRVVISVDGENVKGALIATAMESSVRN